MKHFLLSISLILAAVAQADIAPTTKLLPLLQDSQQRFAFALHKELNRNKNAIESPAGLHELLSLIVAGARGKTAFEIEKALEFGGLSGRITEAYEERKAETPSGTASKNLKAANSLWIQRSFPLLPSFTSLANTTFAASQQSVDFLTSLKKTREQINHWVSTQTEGKIPTLFDASSLSKKSKLVLINTAYFSAQWQYPFDQKQTKIGKFHSLSGRKTQVQYMNQIEQFQVFRGDELDLIVLPYRGTEFQMLIILPKSGQFSKVENQLSSEKMRALRSQLVFQKTRLQLPKFLITSTFRLVDPLKALGIQLAFTPQADFSGMTLEKGLMLGDVLQKAYVRVDEAGTEAAAASAAQMYLTAGPESSDPKPFTVDRPFLFLIEDTTNALPLFLGRVVQPKLG